MTRVVLRSGRVFDGTGADPAPADAATRTTSSTCAIVSSMSGRPARASTESNRAGPNRVRAGRSQ